MNKILGRSSENNVSRDYDTRTDTKNLQTMLMAMIDTHVTKKERIIDSHISKRFKYSAVKYASNFFGVSKQYTTDK